MVRFRNLAGPGYLVVVRLYPYAHAVRAADPEKRLSGGGENFPRTPGMKSQF
ncbi:MAG TPA: hypothetical protein VGR72_00655 [Candidatus Acidoferrales bacterium]|nr:hypothetical protein [Candidatus Acidoferrales bacterium]